MQFNEILDKVRAFADEAHGDQTRKYTPEDRYIVHPVRVMETVGKYISDTAVLSAALLHDVLEDTPVKKEELLVFLMSIMEPAKAKRTVKIVEELTDVYVKDDYPHYNRRKRKAKEADRLEKISPEAQTIKYADIIDNGPETVDQDPDFAERFLSEYRDLLKRINKGNPDLYKVAVKTIDDNIKRLREKQRINTDSKMPN